MAEGISYGTLKFLAGNFLCVRLARNGTLS